MNYDKDLYNTHGILADHEGPSCIASLTHTNTVTKHRSTSFDLCIFDRTDSPINEIFNLNDVAMTESHTSVVNVSDSSSDADDRFDVNVEAKTDFSNHPPAAHPVPNRWTNEQYLAFVIQQQQLQQQQLHQLYLLQQAQLKQEHERRQKSPQSDRDNCNSNTTTNTPQIVYVPVPVQHFPQFATAGQTAPHGHFQQRGMPVTILRNAAQQAVVTEVSLAPLQQQQQRQQTPHIIPSERTGADSPPCGHPVSKGSPSCCVENCKIAVDGKTVFCRAHRSARRCQEDGCAKCAQGTKSSSEVVLIASDFADRFLRRHEVLHHSRRRASLHLRGLSEGGTRQALLRCSRRRQAMYSRRVWTQCSRYV